MKKIHNLPDWFASVDEDDEQFAEFHGFALKGETGYFFDGIIGSFLRLKRVPKAIEIALDFDDVGCLARLTFGSERGDEHFICPFEIESFALLWNADTSTVHGLPENCITLYLLKGETRFPIMSSSKVMCELFLRDGQFRVEPDLEFADELLDLEDAA